MSKPLYSIRDWDEHFEVSQSRKNKHMRWVSIPTKHDGKSFRRLMLRDDGTTIFCAWVLLVQVAAKCPRRGILADADGPLDAVDLHIKTGCPASAFDAAFKVLASREIGWLLVEQWEDTGSALPPHTRQTHKTNQPTPQPPEAAPPTSEPEPSGKQEAGGVAGGSGVSFGWGAVADDLTRLGASRWREAIADAKAAGCNPGLARTLIAFGISKGYGVGAIICRLSKARPTLPESDGWPPLETPEIRATKVAAEKKTAAQRQAELDRDRDSKAAETAQQREAAFGAVLDSMDEGSVQDLLSSSQVMQQTAKRQGPRAPLVRDWLLKQLEAKA